MFNRKQTRRLRYGLVGVATAALLGTSLGVTTPAQSFVGGPGNGGAPQTDAPDLLSVTLRDDNEVNVQMRAAFCFDEQLAAAPPGGNFYVKTYDAGRYLQGLGTATIDPDPAKLGRCAIVSFPPTIDLETQGSIGEVDQGAVQNLLGTPNVYSNAPISNSTLSQAPGRSTGPDLLSIVTDNTQNSVTYTFDQEVSTNPAHVDASRFGLVSDDGLENPSGAPLSATVLPDLKRVRVVFPDGTNVANKIRYYVRSGAVRTQAQTGITGGSSPASSCGLGGGAACYSTPAPDGVVSTGTGSLPVLTNATFDSSGQFRVTYSRPTGVFTPGLVYAVLDNGNVEAAQNAQFIDAQTRVLSFDPNGQVAAEPSAVVKLVSRTGAATDPNPPNTGAPISAVNVGPGAPMKPGYTNAPDLLRTEMNEVTSQATFIYDEVYDQTNLPGTASAFQLLVQNGVPTPGNTFAGHQPVGAPTRLLVSYPSLSSANVGVGMGTNQTRDRLGNPTPYSSVSRDTPPSQACLDAQDDLDAATAALKKAKKAASAAAKKVASAKAGVKKAQAAVKKAKTKAQKAKAKAALKKAQGSLKKATAAQKKAKAKVADATSDKKDAQDDVDDLC